MGMDTSVCPRPHAYIHLHHTPEVNKHSERENNKSNEVCVVTYEYSKATNVQCEQKTHLYTLHGYVQSEQKTYLYTLHGYGVNYPYYTSRASNSEQRVAGVAIVRPCTSIKVFICLRNARVKKYDLFILKNKHVNVYNDRNLSNH